MVGILPLPTHFPAQTIIRIEIFNKNTAFNTKNERHKSYIDFFGIIFSGRNLSFLSQCVTETLGKLSEWKLNGCQFFNDFFSNFFFKLSISIF